MYGLAYVLISALSPCQVGARAGVWPLSGLMYRPPTQATGSVAACSAGFASWLTQLLSQVKSNLVRGSDGRRYSTVAEVLLVCISGSAV